MFESLVAKSEPPHARLPALGLSALIFGSLAALLALWPRGPVAAVRRAVEVSFAVAKPATAAPEATPPSAAATPARRNLARSVAKKRESAPTPALPPTAEPVAAASPAPAAAIIESGAASSPSTSAPTAAPSMTNLAIPFGPGMTRPEQVAGSTPEYTREAIAARVEGKVLVRCVITKQGAINDCKLIKGVPFLDRIALDSLARSRWKPVTYRGQVEAVQYLFTFNFKLP